MSKMLFSIFFLFSSSSPYAPLSSFLIFPLLFPFLLRTQFFSLLILPLLFHLFQLFLLLILLPSLLSLFHSLLHNLINLPDFLLPIFNVRIFDIFIEYLSWELDTQ